MQMLYTQNPQQEATQCKGQFWKPGTLTEQNPKRKQKKALILIKMPFQTDPIRH